MKSFLLLHAIILPTIHGLKLNLPSTKIAPEDEVPEIEIYVINHAHRRDRCACMNTQLQDLGYPIFRQEAANEMNYKELCPDLEHDKFKSDSEAATFCSHHLIWKRVASKKEKAPRFIFTMTDDVSLKKQRDEPDTVELFPNTLVDKEWLADLWSKMKVNCETDDKPWVQAPGQEPYQESSGYMGNWDVMAVDILNRTAVNEGKWGLDDPEVSLLGHCICTNEKNRNPNYSPFLQSTGMVGPNKPYLRGEHGQNECPQLYHAVTEDAECSEASLFLGLTYESTQNQNVGQENSICNVPYEDYITRIDVIGEDSQAQALCKLTGMFDPLYYGGNATCTISGAAPGADSYKMYMGEYYDYYEATDNYTVDNPAYDAVYQKEQGGYWGPMFNIIRSSSLPKLLKSKGPKMHDSLKTANWNPGIAEQVHRLPGCNSKQPCAALTKSMPGCAASVALGNDIARASGEKSDFSFEKGNALKCQ